MIQQMFVLSFITFSLWWTFQEGEIFGVVQHWFADLDDKLKKPLFDCAVCMHFWWGTLSYWLIFGHSFNQDWKNWLATVIAGIGLNAIIVKLWPCEMYYDHDQKTSL